MRGVVRIMSFNGRSHLTPWQIGVLAAGVLLLGSEQTDGRPAIPLRAGMHVEQLAHFWSADEPQVAAPGGQDLRLWRRGADQTRAPHPSKIDASQLFEKARRIMASDSAHASTERPPGANQAFAEGARADANAVPGHRQPWMFVSLVGLLSVVLAITFLIYRRIVTSPQSAMPDTRSLRERQEKLASLGMLATGIAHEIRNPLTAIKVRLFSLKASHQPGTSDHEDLEVIENEIDRLERIVRDFLQFARPADPELQTMPAGRLLQDTAELLAGELAKRSVTIKLDLEANELVRVDSNKMKQVLINFVQNAADSMESGGTVILRARLGKQALNGRAATTVVFDIEDSGTGIPLEVQKRLFDPFFTTKEEGTGLGLVIAARIVEKHGGVIQYRTHPHHGTTFSVTLPLAPNDEDPF
jgi:signal transduction histidine kinase